jgi:hypothetical protein
MNLIVRLKVTTKAVYNRVQNREREREGINKTKAQETTLIEIVLDGNESDIFLLLGSTTHLTVRVCRLIAKLWSIKNLFD